MATHGRVRCAYPGEAGRVRRRASVGTAEDEDEACSGAGEWEQGIVSGEPEGSRTGSNEEED